MSRRHRRTTIANLVEEHREDPRYDTRDCEEDQLTVRNHGTETTLILYTPGRDGKFPGVVGCFDLSEHFNELTENGLTDAFISDNYREHYHAPAPMFIAPRGEDVTDYFDFETEITKDFVIETSRKLPRSNWPSDSACPDPDSAYYVRPDWKREADAEQIDPNEVHNDQTGLDHFEDLTQAEVYPDAIDPKDARIEDLPAFIDTDDRDDCLSKYDSNKHSDPMVCDHCGVEEPWDTPMERGVRSLRRGTVTDGDPDYDHCDPVNEDTKACHLCGCPRCNSKSISHRSTLDPEFRCNNCELEFEHPVKRQPGSDAKRVCLYWLCRNCQKPTQAPFAGIPEALLDN